MCMSAYTYNTTVTMARYVGTNVSVSESGASRHNVSHCWIQLPIINAKLPQNVDMTLW